MLYFLLRYIIRYRRKVVRSNLRLAFPDTDDKTLERYEKDFYHHFVDMAKESIAMTFVSKKRMRKMFTFANIDLVDTIARERGNQINVFGHYGNWDFVGSAPLWTHDFYTSAIYKKLHNNFFNKLFIKIRGRFGILLIEHHDVARKILMAKHNEGKPHLFSFITDQSPKSDKNCDWVKFFGIDTPAIGAWASLALKTNMPVTYLHIRKNGWMRYTGIIEEIKAHDRQELLQKYFSLLEEDIRKQPGLYLWSHKRWKFRR